MADQARKTAGKVIDGIEELVKTAAEKAKDAADKTDRLGSKAADKVGEAADAIKRKIG